MPFALSPSKAVPHARASTGSARTGKKSDLVGKEYQHAFTPFRRSAEHGFTLVELMVVVTIIGLAAAVAVWAMPDPRGRVADEAMRFAGRVKAAHDLAVIDARPTSLWMTSAGYGFDRRVAGNWVPAGDKALRVVRWADGTVADTGDRTARVRVTFDETGLADRPAQLVLSRGGARASVTIGADGNVRADAI